VNSRALRLPPQVAIAALAAVLLLTGGCTSSPATSLYLLTAVPEPAPATRFDAPVGVGPVLLPDYLDRLQVVTRTPSGELAVSDTQRWAEPLQDGLIRVLDENLSALLGTERIVRFPWPRSLAPEFQVALEVLRFESGPDAMLRLDARWWLRGGSGDVILQPRTSRIEVPTGAGVDGRVHAHDEAVARLSREIAAGLQQVATRR